MTTTNTSRPASGTDQRVCGACLEPIAQVSPTRYRHVKTPFPVHAAYPVLAHAMDDDPFAGCDDEADAFTERDITAEPATVPCGDTDPHDPHPGYALRVDGPSSLAGDPVECPGVAEEPFPPADPEPSINLAQFQQRVAAGEWQPEYFVAPNAHDDTTLWRRSSDPERPEEIVTRPALDTLHESLWPAVTAHFVRKGR